MIHLTYIGPRVHLRGKTCVADDATYAACVLAVFPRVPPVAVPDVVMVQFDGYQDPMVGTLAFRWHPFMRTDFQWSYAS